MEKDIQKVLARQTAARAALAGLPDDAPEAIKKRVVEDVELAEAAVWDTNEWLSKRAGKGTPAERRKSWTPGNMVSFLLGAALVFSFVMFLGQEPGPDVRAGGSSYQGTAQMSRKVTVPTSAEGGFTATSSQNIACQQAGYAGVVVEEMKCLPGAYGSCTQTEITMSCAKSQAVYEKGLKRLNALEAEMLRLM